MKQRDLNSMSTDELWSLDEQVVSILSDKMRAERAQLGNKLRELGASAAKGRGTEKVIRTKRSYPPVRPKYKNPKEPFETWSGRGKKPRWLSALLKSGKKLDDFLIQRSA
jgi:DNA-binding protein H-NS